MNSKQLTSVLAVLLVVAVGAWFAVSSNEKKVNKGKNTDVGALVMPSFPMNELSAIQIKKGKDEVNIIRGGDNTWAVKERESYPANYDYVRDLVTKVSELKVVESTQVGKSQMGRVQLLPPGTEGAADTDTGMSVSFKGEGDKDVGTLILGKTIEGNQSEDGPMGFNFGSSTGRFVQVVGKGDLAYKVKESFSSLNSDVKGWLEKQFIQPTGGLKTLELKSDLAEANWKVERDKEGADMVLADKKADEEPNTDNLKSAGSAFSSAYFNDVATAAEKDKAGLEKPVRTATVSYFDGFTYVIKVGNKVKPDDENSDYYLGLTVSYSPAPQPTEPKEAAPEEPKPTPAPDGENEDQKKEREKKDAEAKTAYEAARKRIEDAKKKFEDDKKKWDEDDKKRKERLEKEKSFEGRIYVVSKYTVDWFLKDRKYFLKDKAAAPAATGAPTPSAPGTAATPPVAVPPVAPTAPKPKIEAFTPPVSVEIPPKPADTPKPAPPMPPAAEPKKPDEPKADAPKADAPKADAPKADAPKADAPKADAPKADAPKADAPKADAPKPEAPKAAEPAPAPAEGEKK